MWVACLPSLGKSNLCWLLQWLIFFLYKFAYVIINKTGELNYVLPRPFSILSQFTTHCQYAATEITDLTLTENTDLASGHVALSLHTHTGTILKNQHPNTTLIYCLAPLHISGITMNFPFQTPSKPICQQCMGLPKAFVHLKYNL